MLEFTFYSSYIFSMSFFRAPGRTAWQRQLFFLGLCVIIISLCLPVSGQCESSRNYKIKAGFIYRFILFTEWPEQAFVTSNDTITLGIVGENPFAGFFAQVAGRSVAGKNLKVLELTAADSPERFRQCHLLYIHPSQEEQTSQIIEAVRGQPVVTISDMDDFLEQGGMISFFSRRNRIKFAVHRGLASREGIRFRAQMLKMAAQVVEDN